MLRKGEKLILDELKGVSDEMLLVFVKIVCHLKRDMSLLREGGNSLGSGREFSVVKRGELSAGSEVLSRQSYFSVQEISE